MKNVKDNQLKTCIFLTAEEFTGIVHETLGNDVIVEYTLEGLDIYTDDNIVDVDELHEALQNHFGVQEITSIHMDDCDYVGVWIVYKN